MSHIIRADKKRLRSRKKRIRASRRAHNRWHLKLEIRRQYPRPRMENVTFWVIRRAIHNFRVLRRNAIFT